MTSERHSATKGLLAVEGIQPGDKCFVTRKIERNGQVAFTKNQPVIIDSISPNPQAPNYKYIVYSRRLYQKFQLSDADIRPATKSKPQPVRKNFVSSKREVQPQEITAGSLCLITHDVLIDGQVAFRLNEIVYVVRIQPDVQRPEYRYAVYSEEMKQEYLLSGADLILRKLTQVKGSVASAGSGSVLQHQTAMGARSQYTQRPSFSELIKNKWVIIGLSVVVALIVIISIASNSHPAKPEKVLVKNLFEAVKKKDYNLAKSYLAPDFQGNAFDNDPQQFIDDLSHVVSHSQSYSTEVSPSEVIVGSASYQHVYRIPVDLVYDRPWKTLGNNKHEVIFYVGMNNGHYEIFNTDWNVLDNLH